MSLNLFITNLQQLAPEWISVATFIVCMASILMLLRGFGRSGLYIYTVVAMMVGNLQALKAGSFAMMDQPVALGTIVFASTFLVSDILTEHYGMAVARRCVWLGFCSALLLNILMILTLGVAPLEGGGEAALTFNNAHDAMMRLFLPAPAIFIASLTAYLFSQRIDILVFQRLKTATTGRFLWLRTGAATLLATLLDNVIFSTLAWVILAPTPVDAQTLIWTYIIGTYVFRLASSLFQIPVMYLSRHFLPSEAAAHALSKF